MPPGGHIDPNETPADAAKRECKEETGLDVEILGLKEMLQLRNPEILKERQKNISTNDVQHFNIATFRNFPDLFADCPQEGRMLKTPIAMLLENIPACPERNEEAHQHMDFLFLAKPIDETQKLTLAEEEGHEMRWFTKEDIAALNEETEVFGNVKAYILSVLNEA